MSAAAFATLDEFIRGLETAVGELPQIAKSLVPVLEGEARAAIAGQRSMSGEPWPKTQDGKPALQGAAKALKVEARGTVVVLTLSGHEVWHQFGTKRTPKRPILPSAGLNEKVGNAIRFGVVDAGLAFMNRAGRHDRPKRGRR